MKVVTPNKSFMTPLGGVHRTRSYSCHVRWGACGEAMFDVARLFDVTQRTSALEVRRANRGGAIPGDAGRTRKVGFKKIPGMVRYLGVVGASSH